MSEETTTKVKVEWLDEAGTFEGTAVQPDNGWFGEAGENATPYVRVPVVVYNAAGSEKMIVWQGWLTEAAADNTVRTLAKTFGFDGDLESLAAGRTSFHGKDCQVVVTIETYEGKRRCKVKWLNPANSKPPQMDADKVKSIIGKLTSRAKAVAKAELAGTGQKPAASPPRPAPPKREEGPNDIPM